MPIAILVSFALWLSPPSLPTLAVRSSEVALLARDGAPLLPANGALTSAATTCGGAALESRTGGNFVPCIVLQREVPALKSR